MKKSRSEYNKEWKKKNPNYHREWVAKHPEVKKYRKEYAKKWRAENAEYFKTYKKKPGEYEKYQARQMLNKAVYKGLIVRGRCEVKDCKETTDAHHDNYDKPYDVKWLCRLHHRRYHLNLANQKN